MSEITQSTPEKRLKLLEKNKEFIEEEIVNANIQYHKILLLKQELKKKLSDIKVRIEKCYDALELSGAEMP